MLRFTSTSLEEDLSLGIDLTPLIDVVFLLLIFFMVTTTFTASSAIPIDLPSASSESSSAKDLTLTVSISRQGQIALNGEVLSLEQLQKRLEAEAKDAVLVLRADKEASHGSVVAIMDSAQQAGIASIAVAVEPNAK